MSHLCPKGSTRAPCSICLIGCGPVIECFCSLTGLRSTAPAAKARLCTATGSSTKSSILTVVNRKSSDDVSTTSQVPQDCRAECGFVEIDGGVPVADGQHGRDLRCHSGNSLGNVLIQDVRQQSVGAARGTWLRRCGEDG